MCATGARPARALVHHGRCVRQDIHDDSAAEAIIAFLRSAGAAGLNHAGVRELLDHLTGTYVILRRWRAPVWVQYGGLLHSAYGTDAYQHQLLAVSRRDEVALLAGDRAERLAYLFGTTPRGPLLAGTHRWARDMPTRSIRGSQDSAEPDATPEELDALVLVHMANLAEQTQAADGSPGHWLVRLGELAELIAGEQVAAPPFTARLGELSETDESLVRGAYRDALGEGDRVAGRERRLELAAAMGSVVGEPCVWLAHLARCRGEPTEPRLWARLARTRLLELGTAWDKRLTFDAWLAIADALERQPDGEVPRGARSIDHPRGLLAAYVDPHSTDGPPSRSQRAITPPDGATGRSRFQRYIEALADAGGPSSGAVYPDLPSRPWHNASEFPLVDYLESNYRAIRDEILALGATRFHHESERIGRTGDWDVAFLYERGRRHDDVCAACPVTTLGVESHATIRTMTGLVYVSRMRGGTRITAHRGPTNLRVRCHLAVTVPQGDCAIRVGEDTRRWREGRCLVFDDYFDHEAWNLTDDDRIVLIVDMWHPGLSDTEVMLLEGLDRHTDAQARRLNRYWSANAMAARGEPRPG